MIGCTICTIEIYEEATKSDNDAGEDGEFFGNEEKYVLSHQGWNPRRASDAGDAEIG